MTDDSSSDFPSHPTALLSRRRTFGLLSIQLLNMLGDGLLGVGTTLIILGGTAPSRDLPLFLISSAVSGVLVLVIASVTLDSVDRRRALIVIDAIRVASAGLVVAYMHVSGWSSPVLLVVAGLFVGLSVSVYRPALNAYIGDVVPTNQRTAANSFRSMSSKISSILGPSTAAILASMHWDGAIPVLAAGLAMLSLAAFWAGPAGSIPTRETTTKGDRLAGFRYVRSEPWILAVITQGAVQLGFVSAPIAIIAPLWLTSHGAADQFGYLTAVEAVGATVAALLLIKSQSAPRWLAMPVLLLEVGVLAVIAANSSVAWLYPAYFLLGVGSSVFGVLWIGALQDQVPSGLLGRVLAVDALGNSLFITVGLIVAGGVAQVVSLGVVAIAAGIILILSIAAALVVPEVLTLGRASAHDVHCPVE